MKYTDINSIYDINVRKNNSVSRQQRIDKILGEGTFEEIMSSVENYNNSINFDSPFEFKFHGRSDIDKAQDALKQLELIASSPKIRNIDVETIGIISNNPDVPTKGFATTEISAVEIDTVNASTNTVYKIDMGINNNLYNESVDLFHSLNEGKIADIDPVANKIYLESARVTATRTKYNLGKSDVNVPINEETVMASLKKLNNMPIKYNSLEAGQDLENLYNIINDSIENDIPIMGHNFKQADLVWLNKAFKDNNVNNGIEIDFNKANIIDTLEIVKEALSDDLYEIYSKAGLSNIEGQLKLENLAKLTGIETSSHFAEDDAITNYMIFKNKVLNSGQTLFDILKEKLNTKINNYNVINSNAPVIFQSTRAIRSGDEHLADVMLNSEGNPGYYKDYVTSKNIFYEVEGYNFTPRENLSKGMLDVIGDESDGAYSIKLKSINGDESFGHTSIITRGSQEDLLNTLNTTMKYIDPKENISMEYMNEMFSISEKDSARRNFLSIFDSTSDKGFRYGESLFYAHENLQRAFGNDFTEEGLLKLLKNQSLEVNGRVLNLKEIAPTLYNKNGAYIPERARDIYHLYDTIGDISPIMIPAMEKIKTNIGFNHAGSKNEINKAYGIENDATKEQIVSINRKRTTALKKTYDQIIHDISLVGGELEPSSTIGDTLTAANYVSVKINGEYSNINASTFDSTTRSLVSKVYSNSKVGTKTDRAKRNMIKGNLKIMASDLYERKIIDRTQKEIFDNNIGDPNAATKLLAKMIFDKKTSIVNEIKTNEDASHYVFDMLNKTPPETYIGGVRVNGDSLTDFVIDNVDEIVNLKNGTITNELTFGSYINDVVNTSIKNTPQNTNLYLPQYDPNNPYKKFVNGEITDEYKQVIERIGGFLKDNLGYNDSHINEVAARIIGEPSSMMNNGMSVSMISYKNNTGDVEFGLVGFKPEDADIVQSAIARGEKPKKAIIQPLPNLTTHAGGNLETIVTGYVEKKNMKSITSYIDSDGVVRYSVKDTLTDSIQGPKKAYKKVNYLMSIGKFSEAQRLVEREAKSPIYNASSASSFQTVSANGVKVKKFVPKISDILNPVRIDPVIHSLPKLYRNDKQVFDAINEAIGEERFKNFEDFLEKNPVASLKEATSSVPDIREWIKINLLNGEKILEKIVSMERETNRITGDKGINPEVIDFYDSIVKNNASQINTKKDAEYLTVYMERPEKFMVGSHLNHPRREQTLQNLKSLPILNQEIEENAKKYGESDPWKYFESKQYVDSDGNKIGPGINLGDSVRTYETHSKYMKTVGSEFAEYGGITTEIYGGIKQLDPASAQLLLEEFNINDDIKQEFKNKYGYDLNEKVSEKIINAMREAGTTNEQHSIVRPSVDRYFAFNDELKTVSVDTEMIPTLKIGQRIDENTVIGKKRINGREVNIKYSGENGTITFIDPNTDKVFVDLLQPAFSQKKYIYHGFEKSVASSFYKVNDIEYFNEGEFLYDKLFGEGTISVAYMPFAKHETGSVMVVPELSLLAEMGKNQSPELQDEILSMLNNRVKGWDASFATDTINKNKNILLTQIPYLEGSDIDAAELLVEDFRKIANDESNTSKIKSFANEYIKTYDYYKENNIIFGSAKRSALSESGSISNDIVGSRKGMKYDVRADQIFGSFFTDEYMVKGIDGKYQNAIEPIKKILHSEIMKNNNYDAAEQELKSLYGTIEAYSGKDLKNYRVATVTTSDLMLPPTSLLNMETLNESVFGVYRDNADFLEIKVKNAEIINPIKFKSIYDNKYKELVDMGKRESTAKKEAWSYMQLKDAKQQYMQDSVFMPIGSPLIIDDSEMYYSNTMKNSASIINDIQKLEDLDVTDANGIKSVNDQLNKKVLHMIAGMKHELSNKDGLVHSQMLSGRLDYSISLLGAGIADMHFEDKTGKTVLHPFSQRTIKIENDKPVYYDMIGVSKDTIRKMGIKDSVVAQQILNEKSFVSDEFIKELVDSNYINKDKTYKVTSFKEFSENRVYHLESPPPTYLEYLKNKFPTKDFREIQEMYNNQRGGIYQEYKEIYQDWYDQRVDFDDNLQAEYELFRKEEIAKKQEFIANKYYREYGLEAVALRHPLFHNESMLVTKAVLVDSLDGDTNILSEFLAKKFNADIDGDHEFLKFLFEKDTNGDLKLFSRESDAIRAVETVWKAQAHENQTLADKKIKDGNYGFEVDEATKKKRPKISKKDRMNFAIDSKTYKENLFEMYGHDELIKNSNYHIREKSIQTAIKAPDNMTAIGNISTKNFLLRTMTENDFEIDSAIDYRNLYDFTHEVEQNIISVKHDVDGTLVKAGLYADSLTRLAQSSNVEDVNKEFETFVDILNNSDVYDKGYELPKAQDIINGNFDNTDIQANRVKSLYSIFTNEDRRKAFLDPLNKTGYVKGTYKDIEDVLSIMGRVENVESTSNLSKSKLTILKNLNDGADLKKTDGILRKRNISGDFDEIKIIAMGRNKKGGNIKQVKIQNQLTNESKILTASTYDEIANKINKEYMTEKEFEDTFTDANAKAKYNYDSKLAYSERQSLNMLTNYDEAVGSSMMYELLKEVDKNNERVLGVKEISTFNNSELIDRTSFKNADNKTRKILSTYLDNFKSLNQQQKIQKANMIFGTHSGGDYKTLRASLKQIGKALSNGSIEKSTATDILSEINSEIIQKGREAKARREKGPKRDANTIKGIIDKYKEKQKGVEGISQKIDDLKIIGNESILKYRREYYENANKILLDANYTKETLTGFNDVLDIMYLDTLNRIKEYNTTIVTKQSELFNNAFFTPGGKEQVLKWNEYKNGKFINTSILSKSKIGFGKYANLSIKDLSLDDLMSLANDTSFDELDSPLIKESQQRINDYLTITRNKKIKNSNRIFTRNTNTSTISESYDAIGKVIDSNVMNESILKRAEEFKNFKAAKGVKETIENTSEALSKAKAWYKNKHVIGAGVVGAVLGLTALATSGKSYISGGTVAKKRTEEDSYKSNVNGKARPTVYQAPSTVRGKQKGRAIVEGVNMKVKGKASNDVDKRSMANNIRGAVSKATNNDVNVNYNDQDSRENISDNWVKNKMANAIR